MCVRTFAFSCAFLRSWAPKFLVTGRFTGSWGCGFLFLRTQRKREFHRKKKRKSYVLERIDLLLTLRPRGR